MFLSIIIPVYNTEKYLSECLDSIINQDFTDYEVILVDDGSTDSSGNICDEYAEKYGFIKVFHKENEGQYLTRLYGTNKAEGEYIWFVDSDDIISDKSLSILKEKCEKHNYPDLLLFNMIIFENKKMRKYHLLFNEETVFKDKSPLYDIVINSYDLNSLCTKLINKKLILNLKNQRISQTGIKHGEDVVLSIDILTAAQKITYITDHLYIYRVHDGSVSRVQYNYEYVKKVYNREYYLILLSYLDIWSKNTEENRKKIYHSDLLKMLQFFILCCIYSQGKIKLKKILNNDWLGLLLPETLQNVEIRRLPIIKKLEFLAIKRKSFLLILILMFFKAFVKKLKKRNLYR